MTRRRTALHLLAPLLIGCACARVSGDSGGDGAGRGLVPFEVLLQTSHSCHGEERDETVLRDRRSWAEWWDAVLCGSRPAPEVDLEGSMILAVRDQTGPNGCYAVRVAEVRRDVGTGLRVIVHRHVPSRLQTCTMALVHPATAVRVGAVAGPVQFEWKTVTGPPPEEAEP